MGKYLEFLKNDNDPQYHSVKTSWKTSLRKTPLKGKTRKKGNYLSQQQQEHIIKIQNKRQKQMEREKQKQLEKQSLIEIENSIPSLNEFKYEIPSETYRESTKQVQARIEEEEKRKVQKFIKKKYKKKRRKRSKKTKKELYM